MKRSLAALLILCALGSSSIATAGGATVTYIYTDAQGSPVAEADGAGNVTATFDYTPFGSTLLGTQQNGPGFTGHVADPDTSLTYMQARYYDPSMGQFLSVDPVISKAGQISSFGAYAYAGNNPTTHIDPDGKEWVEHTLTGYTVHFVDSPSAQSGGGSDHSGGGGEQNGEAQTTQNHSQQSPQSSGDQAIPYKHNVPPAAGRLEQLLQCIQAQCPGEVAAVTSTTEPMPQNRSTGQTPHAPDTPHGRGEAADLRVVPGHENHVLQCAANCGAGFGLNERAHPSANATGPHDHVQLGPGLRGGRGDLPQPEEHQ